MSAGRTEDSAGPETRAHKQPIDKVTAADSMVALLSELNTESFSREERLAISRLQSSAIALRLNWVSELCRTLANRNVEFREGDQVGEPAEASARSSAQRQSSPGKWWKWARASYVAGKARLGSS